METRSKQIRQHELANNICWSLLPGDILEKILEKLCFSHCLRAVATCKNWNMIPIPAISKSLPWMIEQDWSIATGSNGRKKLCCKLNLYEVFNPKVYTPICRTFDLAGDYDHQFRRFRLVGPARVKDSKFGWLLIEIRIFTSVRKRSRFLILYSPFVQDLDHQFRFLPASEIPMVRQATFSCPPTSSDCVVYAITETDRGTPSLNIHTWRWCNDQMNWKVESYNNSIIPNCMFQSAVATKDGTLYCLGQNAGNLIAFQYSPNSTLVRNISTDQIDLVGRVISDARLAERDGELFLGCCCRFESCWRFHMVIYRYDTSANCWFMKQRPDPPGPAFMQIGNRVYVWRRGINGLMFYSFEDGKLSHVAAEEIFPSYHRGSGDGVNIVIN